MRAFRTLTPLGAATVTALVLGCQVASSPDDSSISSIVLDHKALCDPSQTGFSTTSTNPYFPFDNNTTWTYHGVDGTDELDLVISVLQTPTPVTVDGIQVAVIEERESVNGKTAEVSRNFFAQAPNDGPVCYFGEEVDIYDADGNLIPDQHPGQWRSDEGENGPGIIMPASPRQGMKFKMEDAPGIAEDEGTILRSKPVTVPLATYSETIKVRESNPLDHGRDEKFYAANVGLLIDEVLQLVAFTP